MDRSLLVWVAMMYMIVTLIGQDTFTGWSFVALPRRLSRVRLDDSLCLLKYRSSTVFCMLVQGKNYRRRLSHGEIELRDRPRGYRLIDQTTATPPTGHISPSI